MTCRHSPAIIIHLKYHINLLNASWNAIVHIFIFKICGISGCRIHDVVCIAGGETIMLKAVSCHCVYLINVNRSLTRTGIPICLNWIVYLVSCCCHISITGFVVVVRISCLIFANSHLKSEPDFLHELGPFPKTAHGKLEFS